MMGAIYAGHDEEISSLTLSSVVFDNVLSYSWYNLAASSNDREIVYLASRNRDRIAKKLSPAEVAEAERLSSRWKKGALLVRE